MRRANARVNQPVVAQEEGYDAAAFAPIGLSSRSRHSLRRLVGLGRLELPTSRLSSARSNQLSYKPLTTRSVLRALPLARVRPRRKRNEDGEIPPMELNNPEIVGP